VPKAPSILRRLFSSPARAADRHAENAGGGGGGGRGEGAPGGPSDALVPAPAEAGGTAALLQVSVLEFRVSGLEFRNWGLGFRAALLQVSVLEFRVSGFGFRV